MPQTKQAKVLSEGNIKAALGAVATGNRPLRDTVAILMSVRAGLRAKEIAGVIWSMVIDPDGNVGDELVLTNLVSKGKRGGRVIPLNRELKSALQALHADARPNPDEPIIGGTANAITVWFYRLYAGLDLNGASSHSGRRTALTRWARKAVEAGGSLRDVQQLAGHAALGTTQRYIDPSEDAKRKLVNL
jgi:integrase